MAERNPRDGEPYYCKTCGLGLGEFYACEEPDCELEDRETAQARKAPPNPTGKETSNG